LVALQALLAAAEAQEAVEEFRAPEALVATADWVVQDSVPGLKEMAVAAVAICEGMVAAAVAD
jgi:nucleoside phosphorylase